MARFLFTVWPFPGHANPTIAVAEALRARGHEVAFYSGATAAATLVDFGIPLFPMRHVDEDALYRRLFPEDDGAGRTASMGELRRMRVTLRTWLVDTLPGQMADLEPVLDHWRPDVIVCDPAMWAPYLVVPETRHLPVAIFSWAMAWPLTGRGLPPPTTWRRRLHRHGERILTRGAMRAFPRGANALRARYGLPPLTQPVIEHANSMPLHIVASIPELNYVPDTLPPSIRFVGWCAWSRPSTGSAPEWIARLRPETPLIYVTEGTLQGGQPRLLQAAARGLADLPIQVLLKDAQILKPDRRPDDAGLGRLAPNVMLESYTQGRGWQNDMLARTSVVVTNGGAGSVMAALSAGVPLIVVPTAWDKPENAQRVVEAGAGLRLSPHRCTPQRLRAAVQEVLGNASFRANARRLSAALGQYDGPRLAAELLDGFYKQRNVAEGHVDSIAVPVR